MDTRRKQDRLDLKARLTEGDNGLIPAIPKVEQHVHIEGTLTADLRWKLAQRQGLQELRFGGKSKIIKDLEQLRTEYANVISSAQLGDYAGQPNENIPPTFFQAYYSGFDVLQTKADFYDLAVDYYKKAASWNVRYCEIFFDPQGHTSRGVEWADFMEGFREAQQYAVNELNVHSSWIMCFLRDQSPESAMKHYNEALEYKDMIVGFGLDSNEFNRPPMLFDEIFTKARQDGFKITSHCDVGVKDTHEHIRQVASTLGGTGADRIDHGLNTADKPELMQIALQNGVPLTICPWAYLRREAYGSISTRIRALIDNGLTISISSDSPAYMDDTWLLHNMMITRDMCGLSDGEVIKLVKNSIDMSWAGPDVKDTLLEQVQRFVSLYYMK